MNQITIVNTLHQAFLKVKNVSLFVLILGIMLISVSTKEVFGESVVHTIETKINVAYDGQEKTFFATQNTVEAAMEQGGIRLEENDITEPSRQTVLSGNEIQVKVTRALPILVSEDGKEELKFTAYTDTKDILKQLGYALDPVDIVESELILDPVISRAVGQKIVVKRAPSYVVNVDDEQKSVKSWGKTVREILEGNIALGKNDIIEPSLDSGIIGNVSIQITRVNEAEVEEKLEIPYQIITKNDFSMYEGKSRVEQEGVNGEKFQKVKIIYHNGLEIDRQVLSSTVTTQPINKVVVKGVKPYDAGALWDILVAAGSKYGVNPSDMYRVMMCESGGRVNAGTTYKGLFQWDGSFYNWAAKAGFPGANIYDPTAQIYATALRVSQNGWSAWGCKP